MDTAENVVAAGDPMEPVPHRVVAVRPESAGVVTLTLDPLTVPLSGVRPGQFVMLWAFGVGEVPISVSRTGSAGRLLLTVRAVGATTTEVTGFHVGEVVGVRGPFGTSWPMGSADGRSVLVVAGGLGVAPLRMAIDQLAAGLSVTAGHGPSSVTVVVGARRPEALLYPDDVERWLTAGVHVHLTVDAADRSWHGAVGTTTAVVQRLVDRHDLAFICGPELMMTTGARAAVLHGVAADEVWVSLERNMHCGVGHCGRCQLGPLLLCRDGAVVRWADAATMTEVRGR